MTRRNFTEAEIAKIRAEYVARVSSGGLDDLSVEMGRHRSTLCRKAAQLGLTDVDGSRARNSKRGAPSLNIPGRWAGGHPKGMSGKKHTDLAKAEISAATKRMWASSSEDSISSRIMRAQKTRRANHGSGAGNWGGRGSWKAGWREIGGYKKYYRSRWEANYARYLEWLKSRGEISDWKHEPETFWFEAIKRGVRSYLPDFRVWENNGSSRLHEVKGWMDDRSKTTLKRMAKYHPSETIILIEKKAYEGIQKSISPLIPDWE